MSDSVCRTRVDFHKKQKTSFAIIKIEEAAIARQTLLSKLPPKATPSWDIGVVVDTSQASGAMINTVIAIHSPPSWRKKSDSYYKVSLHNMLNLSFRSGLSSCDADICWKKSIRISTSTTKGVLRWSNNQTGSNLLPLSLKTQVMRSFLIRIHMVLV